MPSSTQDPSGLLPYQQNSEKEHNAQALLQLEVVMRSHSDQ